MVTRKRTSRSNSVTMRSVTMRDVAQLANVSQSTVSRVLSQASLPISIGEETKQRVFEAVKQLGYQPNLYAGSLRGQKSRLLAMMIADIANSFYHPMVRAVQDVAHKHGYDVLVANSDHLRANEVLFCESIMRRPVDGIIMVPYHLTPKEIEPLIERTGAAVAVLGSHFVHPAVDTVCVDDGKGVYDLITWLIRARNHQRIACIGVTRAFSVGARRQDAFLRALADAGLTAPPTYLPEGDWSVESGQQLMQALLHLPTPPTAIFACNDNMAIGAIMAAQAMGVRVPEDVAVVGFDDIPAASWIRPRLTTVAQFPAVIGERLATAVFEQIEGEDVVVGRRFEAPCQFIERESA